MSKAFFTNSGSEANDTAMRYLVSLERPRPAATQEADQPQARAITASHRRREPDRVARTTISRSTCRSPTSCTPPPRTWREALPGETEQEFSSRMADDLEKLILAEGAETIRRLSVAGDGRRRRRRPAAANGRRFRPCSPNTTFWAGGRRVICVSGRNRRNVRVRNLRPQARHHGAVGSRSPRPTADISGFSSTTRFRSPLADEEATGSGTFGHGFTGGGHPVAAAVALEKYQDHRGAQAGRPCPRGRRVHDERPARAGLA